MILKNLVKRLNLPYGTMQNRTPQSTTPSKTTKIQQHRAAALKRYSFFLLMALLICTIYVYLQDMNVLVFSDATGGTNSATTEIPVPSKELLSKFDFLQGKHFNKDKLPPIDRPGFTPKNEMQANWIENGFHIERGGIPMELIDQYRANWKRYQPPESLPNGVVFATQYMYVKANRDILCHENVQRVMAELIGEPMGLHLSLTGWLSTTRDWHQDGYLNPDDVQDHYIAVWIALEDIHPDSGPFQFIPGSHRWGIHITQKELKSALTPEEAARDTWPTSSERILTPLFEELITNSEVPVHTYLPKKGDILFWHARLTHRGSRANVPGTQRPALIGHFSGIHHRADMSSAVPYSGGYLFPLKENLGSLVETFEPIYVVDS